MPNKTPTSFRLSSKAKRLLEELSRKYGISRTAILEMVIREKARESLEGHDADESE